MKKNMTKKSEENLLFLYQAKIKAYLKRPLARA